MSKITIGEALCRRKLKLYQEGNYIKYIPGQGKVSKLSDEDAIVSYVDITGTLNILPVEKIHDEWFHRGIAIVSGSDHAVMRPLARQMPLGSETMDLLNKAYGEKEEAPPPEDTTAEEPQPQDPESKVPSRGKE